MSTFGERLREARERKGLTRGELAKNLCWRASDIERAETVLQEWESRYINYSDVRLSDFRKLCQALDVSADDLLGLVEDPA